MKAVRELEQVIRQNVWPKIVQHLRNNLGELAKPPGQTYLRSVVKNKILYLRGDFARFAEDRTDPDVSVLQIRSGVSLQCQHLVPRKNVIGHSILGEVGVFDRANADRPRDVDLFRIG